jgi:hypothetical protein
VFHSLHRVMSNHSILFLCAALLSANAARAVQPRVDLLSVPSAGALNAAHALHHPSGVRCHHVRDIDDLPADPPGNGESFVSTTSDDPPAGLSNTEWIQWLYDHRNPASVAHAGYLWMRNVEGHGQSVIDDAISRYNRAIAAINNPTDRQRLDCLMQATKDALAHDSNAVCRHHAYVFCRLANDRGFHNVQFIAWGYSSGGHNFNRITIGNTTYLVDAYNTIVVPQ